MSAGSCTTSFRRTAISFDTRDHALDIVVEPDGRWQWKDDDHVELATRVDAFSREEAAEIRAEGKRVLADWPFPTGWEHWRPDPGWRWPISQLPDGWDVVSEPA